MPILLVLSLSGCRSQETVETTPMPIVDETAPISVAKSGEGMDPSAGEMGQTKVARPVVPPAPEPSRLLFTSYPETFTLARSGSVAFRATEGEGSGAMSFACAWDGGAFGDCNSPFDFSVSGPGGHSIRVEMRRADGSVAGEGSRSFVVGPKLLKHTSLTAFLTNNSLQVREHLEDQNGTIYLATSKGLVVFAKAAASPVLRPVVQGVSALNNMFAVARDGAGRIFVGTGAGYAFTLDEGLTWSVRGVADGLPHSTVTTVQFDAKTGRTYIGTYGGVVATSDGQVFQPVTLTGGPATGIAQLAIYPDGRTIVSNTASRLFVANAITGPFTQVPGMTSSSTFKVGPTGDVYIYGSAGIFISSDRGASFSQTARTTAHGLPANDVRGVGITRDGVIYASTTGGLAASYDGGTTFTSVAVPSSMSGSSFFRHLTTDEKGRLFFVGNDFAAFTEESLEPVQDNSDAAGPYVEDRGLVLTSVGRSGGGVAWNLAQDDVSAARNVAYLLFKSNAGTLAHIGEVFSTATLVDPRRFGVRNASIPLASGASTYLYLVAMDEAGNALLYQPLQMTATTAAAQSLSFTQVTADAGLGAPIDHAVVAKGPWVYHIGGVSLVGGVSILNQVAFSPDQVN